jgi:uncharacterized membrane protein YdjX (TVP38/TMEM64 family)
MAAPVQTDRTQQHPTQRHRAHRIALTRSALLRLGGLLLILAATSLVGYRFGWFDYRHTLEHVTRLRQTHSFPLFATSFVLISGFGTALGLPGLPFIVAAGALFGTLLGSALAWIGAMLGSLLGYFVARTVGHDIVVKWVRRFRRVDEAVESARDFAGMLRLRLVPVLPLGVVNFVGGLARVPIAAYIGATALGIIPATVIYAYFADSLLEGARASHGSAVWSVVVATVLLFGLSLAPKFLRSR